MRDLPTFDVDLVEWIIPFNRFFAVFLAFIFLIFVSLPPLVAMNDVSLGTSILHFLWACVSADSRRG